MKTLLYTYKFLFLSLMTLPLAMCSNDDSNQTSFEAVIINLAGLEVHQEDTSFTADGYNFDSFGACSITGNTDYSGVAFCDMNSDTPSMFILDLNGISSISLITITMFNNGAGSTVLRTLNNETTVQQINDDVIPAGAIEFEINVANQIFNALQIQSAEATIQSIKLE